MQNLSKKNYRASVTECRTLVNRHSPELERHLFRLLLSRLPAKASSADPASSPAHTRSKEAAPVLSFLQEETDHLVGTPKFSSLLLW